MDKKIVIFCTPGNSFSGRWLSGWVDVKKNLKGYDYFLSQGSSCNIFYQRTMCLGANVLKGKTQKPFQGNIKYDYLFYMSPQVLYTHKDVTSLLECADKSDKDTGIISANIKDNALYDENGDIDTVDLHFAIIKYGVIERLSYPWFVPNINQTEDELDFVDITFCNRVIKLGYKIVIDNNTLIKMYRGEIYE